MAASHLDARIIVDPFGNEPRVGADVAFLRGKIVSGIVCLEPFLFFRFKPCKLPPLGEVEFVECFFKFVRHVVVVNRSRQYRNVAALKS